MSKAVIPGLSGVPGTLVMVVAMAALACQHAGAGSLAAPDIPETIAIPAGPFWAGSSREEREQAYRLDERAYGHSRTRDRGWYERDRPLKQLETGAYRITITPVTNARYAVFVQATGHPVPGVTKKVWDAYGLVHPYDRTRRHAWGVNGSIPEGRENHPVVLVSQDDARAYGAWLSTETGFQWRLPSEEEWEKAARGTDGRWFPWGNTYAPDLLNSHDRGPFDTVPTGQFPAGASPYGLLDAAGQVFEWTASTYTASRYIVKGGSWDDKGCGICRPAARHTRPQDLKHILVGFRLVRDQ